MTMLRSLLCICVLTGLTSGQTPQPGSHEGPAVESTKAATNTSRYTRLALADLVAHPDHYRGKSVAITGEVVSIDARCQAVSLYEAPSKTLIKVSLARVPKAERRALVLDPVRHVSVYGKVEMQAKQYLVRAHKVAPTPAASGPHRSPLTSREHHSDH